MDMYINGRWTGSERSIPVIAPFTQQIIDRVPCATREQIEECLAAAVGGAEQMARLTASERSQLLLRAADLLERDREDLARLISTEEGKPLSESRAEVGRMPDLLRLCAFEGSQHRGEVLPLDAQAGTRGKFGFTKPSPCGVVAVGERIIRVAGIKKLAMELGSNSAMIVLPDADLDTVAKATAIGGYANAGQVCISVQRAIVHREVYQDFLDALKPAVLAISVGNLLAEDTRLGPLVSSREAERVAACITDDVAQGAHIVVGGAHHDGALMPPTIISDVKPTMRLFREELFGPAVGVMPVESLDQAIAMANDSRFGLSVSIFTQDINRAMRFAQAAQAGNVNINWTPLYRADLMPYGGLKDSGFGKECPRHLVREMTDSKTVVIHGLDT